MAFAHKFKIRLAQTLQTALEFLYIGFRNPIYSFVWKMRRWEAMPQGLAHVHCIISFIVIVGLHRKIADTSVSA
jgi:hypothetical protein